MSDSALPSTSFTNNENITSISNSTENSTFTSQTINFQDIDKRLDETLHWLNSVVLKVAISGSDEEKTICFKKVSQLRKTGRKIINEAKKTKADFPVACKECGSILIDKDEPQNVTNEVDINCDSNQSEPKKTFSTEPKVILKYDSAIEDFYFPEAYMKEAYLIDKVPEFTIQDRKFSFACLLCQIYQFSRGFILPHVRSSKHMNNAIDPIKREILRAFHTHFTNLPPNYQAHLIFFEPFTKEEINCCLCDTVLRYNDFKSHIMEPKHKHAVLNGSATNEGMVLRTAFSVYDYQKEDINSDTEFPSDDAVVNFLISKAEQNSDAIADNHVTDEHDRPAEFKFNFTIPQNDVVEPLTKPPELKLSLTLPQDKVEDQPNKQQTLEYAPYVLSIAFPGQTAKASLTIDNMSFCTIQFRNELDAYCLLCNCLLVIKSGAVKGHLKGSKHFKQSENQRNLSMLKSYHIGFMRLPFELQAHVIYFRPVTPNKTRCTLCSESIDYSLLKWHIFDDVHKTAVLVRMKSEFFRNKEPLLRYAVNIYSQEEQDKSDESSNKSTDSPIRNGGIKKNSASAETQIVHDIVKSTTNSESTSFFEQLENRFRSHLNVLVEFADSIFCKCCDGEIPKIAYLVKKHLISDTHKAKIGVANIKYKYVCYVCYANFSRELSWQEHLQQELHIRRCTELSARRKAEYECRTCNVIIFGDKSCIYRHKQYNKDANKKKKQIILTDEVKALFKSSEHINCVATQFVLEAKSVVQNQENVINCCKALEVALANIFPDCRAYPFGSRVSGLGNENSDLDVFVDIGGMYLGKNKQDAKSQEEIVIKAAKVFKKYPNKIFTHINPVPTARTPIVQVFHTVTHMDCDLSFRHGLSVENTKFLRVCMEVQPITQPLILTLKNWSQNLKLDENITTYALSMMTIFYLQTRGLLLSVKEMKTINSQQLLVIDGWETIAFTSDIDAMKNSVTEYTGTLTQLLYDFFKYYSEFNYKTDVVCPLLGRTFLKANFISSQNGELLPPEMQTYIVKLTTEKEPELFRALSPLCVQDPFDLSHNLTKACAVRTVDKLKTLCELSMKYLQNVK